MKQLGKVLLKGAKTAMVGYCAYKLIDAAIKNKKKQEPEEYIPFDDLPVEEPKKEDKVKKAVMIAGGIGVVAMIYAHQANKKADEILEFFNSIEECMEPDKHYSIDEMAILLREQNFYIYR